MCAMNPQASPQQSKVKKMSDHLEQLFHVGAINALALVVSMTDVEVVAKIFSCSAAGVYTVVKIVQTLQDMKRNNKP